MLHVTSQASGEIWRYTTATGALITPALKTGLYGPTGLAFDAAGANLYFADPLDAIAETTDSLKKLALPGGALTVIGTVVGAEFYGVALNGTQVFATDTDGNRVVRFPIAGGAATTVIGTGLSMPKGILFRSATQMLIADCGSDRVLEYTLSGGVWGFSRVVLPASAGVLEPCGLALAPDGRLTVTGCSSNDVVLVDLTTLAVTPLVAPGAGGLGVAEGRGLERQHAARRQRERERRDLLRLRRQPDGRARARRLDGPRRRHRLLAGRPAPADRQLARRTRWSSTTPCRARCCAPSEPSAASSRWT